MNPVLFGVCGVLYGLACSGYAAYLLWANRRKAHQIKKLNDDLIAKKIVICGLDASLGYVLDTHNRSGGEL